MCGNACEPKVVEEANGCNKIMEIVIIGKRVKLIIFFFLILDPFKVRYITRFSGFCFLFYFLVFIFALLFSTWRPTAIKLLANITNRLQLCYRTLIKIYYHVGINHILCVSGRKKNKQKLIPRGSTLMNELFGGKISKDI